MEDVLPFYLSIGVSYELFMDSCPKELEPYDKAHILKEKRMDRHMYDLGMYFAYSIGMSFSKDAKYPERPFYEQAEIDNRPLTDKEKSIKVNQFFAELEMLGKEFNDSKKNDR